AGVSVKSLRRFQSRSRLLSNPELGAYVREPPPPRAAFEVFFDIEDDPLQGHCYLHGFLIRDGEHEEYFGFFADGTSSAAEHDAFRDAWDLIRALPGDAPIYYYSPHERTWWRNLQECYPDVCSIAEVEDLFSNRAVDLYTDFVRKHS